MISFPNFNQCLFFFHIVDVIAANNEWYNLKRIQF